MILMEFPDGCVVLEQCGESSESRRLAGSMFEEREVKKASRHHSGEETARAKRLRCSKANLTCSCLAPAPSSTEKPLKLHHAAQAPGPSNQ